jgi:riboflavin kinase / FMN adenylyltransferase
VQIHPPDAPIPENARGAAIALGNFDGVHLGHQAVAASARAAAEHLGAPFGAAVFGPHPRRLFQPDIAPFALQSPAQRARALAGIGARHVFEIRFDRALAGLSDAEFAERVLAARLGVAHVSVGFDFRYGKGRAGDVESLQRQGAQFGFGVDIVDAVDDEESHEKVSSSAIRAAIQAGAMDEAAHMLGRPWAIEGEVLRGLARGRELDAPTANVALGDYVRPRLGIYAVRVDLGEGGTRDGVASIGVNPTIGPLPEPLLEAHLLDYSGDLYGHSIEVQLIAFLREELKFDSLDALKTQIAWDKQAARKLLNAAP